MKSAWLTGLVMLGMATLVIGCGGSTEPSAEQKDPGYGVNSMDKMKGMVGTPKAHKSENALEKMRRMRN